MYGRTSTVIIKQPSTVCIPLAFFFCFCLFFFYQYLFKHTAYCIRYCSILNKTMPRTKLDDRSGLCASFLVPSTFIPAMRWFVFLFSFK
ncbi:uncharacterized protein V2V93DRAFT_371184 [Kockiozyma suomiensis]|uniref:uncharacterized protein n=1 Tax=Kockiozyma suomiensis TaxID=1337062 RepID=UPI0033438B18